MKIGRKIGRVCHPLWTCSVLGSMQGMFGTSVSEFYLLNKLLINIEDSRSMCDHKKKYTCVHRNCESGLAIIYKHAAHRLVQHTLQVMEMAWTDDSTLAISIALL